MAVAMTALAALALSGCAGGEGGPETAALASKPLPRSQARLKIYRDSGYVGSLSDARLKIDGREVATISDGSTKIIDVPAGAHQIEVDHWSHPNVFKLDLQAKPGMLYELQVSARQEAAVAGMFGLLGAAVEAAANENGGTWKIELVRQTPTG